MTIVVKIKKNVLHLLIGLLRVRNLYEVMHKTVNIEIIRINNVDDSYGVLRQLDGRLETESRHVVIDLSTDNALEKILRQVS